MALIIGLLSAVLIAVTAARSGTLSRSRLHQDLEFTQSRLEALGHLRDLTRDYLWLDDTWVLAFRIAGGSGRPSYDAFYNRSAGISSLEDVCGKSRNYRNRELLDNWPSSLVDTVRVSVRKNGEEVAFTDFNGAGSKFDSWFDKARVINSTWTDIKAQTALHFSIAGWTVNQTIKRRFYMCKNHGGCGNVAGWMAVLDVPDECTGVWSNANTDTPIILYSTQPHLVKFAGTDMDVADEMVIAVKLRDVLTCPGTCTA